MGCYSQGSPIAFRGMNDKETFDRNLEQAIFDKMMTLPEPDSHYAWSVSDEVAPFAQDGDVYSLLTKVGTARRLRNEGCVAITSMGWAAPHTWDGEPSKCPERRRVCLTLLISLGNSTSLVRFVEDEEVLWTDASETRGAMAEAAQELVEAAKSF